MNRPHIGVMLHEGAVMPEYKHLDERFHGGGDAACDLSALYLYDPATGVSTRIKDLYGGVLVVQPGGQRVIGTGVHLSLPPGWKGKFHSRSGLAAKLSVEVGAGLMDNGYTGEYRVVLHNHGKKPLTIKEGDRIAQVEFQPYYQAQFYVMRQMPETVRGENGYASTGGVSQLIDAPKPLYEVFKDEV